MKTSSIPALLLSTRNRHKTAEAAAILAPVPVVALDEAERETGLRCPEVVEDGSTYEENAVKKARAAARTFDRPAIADDSGLEVEALGGEPGLRSARYGGPGASSQEQCHGILEEVEGVGIELRGARFVCVIALAWPDGRAEIFEGTCEGRVAERMAGGAGFGYDPIFHVIEMGCTMAELSPETKNRISHRAKALDKLKRRLLE